VSCSLLVAAAQDGSSVASENSPLNIELIMDAPALANTMNSMNHQYSGRDALPVKSAYFSKHTLIAS
jgi:hypothetical protein